MFRLILSDIKFSDIIDIFLVAYFFYSIIKQITATRATNLLRGLVLIILLTALTPYFKLNSIYWLLKNFFPFGVIVIVIIFQPEIRTALERMGSGWFPEELPFIAKSEISLVVAEISEALLEMSRKKIGGLIVLEGKLSVHKVCRKNALGTELNAKITSNLIRTIFHDGTVLHDGAIVINGDKIITASTHLPLSKKQSIKQELGTRHRAAMGITEQTDAWVFIVSEERGDISFASRGDLKTPLTVDKVKNLLREFYEKE